MHLFHALTRRILATFLLTSLTSLLAGCSSPALARFLKNYDLEAGATYTTPSGSSVGTYVKLKRNRSGKGVVPTFRPKFSPSGKDIVTRLPNLPGVDLHIPADGPDTSQKHDPIHDRRAHLSWSACPAQHHQ